MAHVCPIDGNKVNEPTVRTVAALVTIIAIAGIATQSLIPFAFLAYDFFVRGFSNREGSLLRWLAIKIVDAFDFAPRLIDGAPKRFAAKVGFVFSITLVILAFFHLWIAFYAVGAILLACAILESAFAYCVGCEVYALLIRFDIISL